MNWLILITGFGGGILRGLVGFIKHQFSYKDVKFDLFYFLLMMFLSGIVGGLVAFIFEKDAVFSFVVGYAGGDFIENFLKTLTGKKDFSQK